MLRRRAMSYELVFKALEFQAILKRGGGGGRGARKSANRKLPSLLTSKFDVLLLSLMFDIKV